MSSMLEQAIVDASALRDAAIQNAEQAVIEKYSSQIKGAVDKILEEDIGSLDEQEEPAVSAEEASFGEDAPKDVDAESKVDAQLDEADKGEAYAFLEGSDLSDLEEGEEVEISIEDLLETMATVDDDDEFSDDDIKVKKIAKVIVVKDDDEINDDDDVDVSEKTRKTETEASGEGELDETLKMDYTAAPMAGTTAYGATIAQQETESIVLDVLQQIEFYNTELEKKNEKLKKENKEFKSKYQFALKENKKYTEKFKKIKEKFQEVEVYNAKLLYTNKVFMDASLNERQKKEIVESINKAQTFEQAKIVYETLQGAVGSASHSRGKKPESLSEAVGKRSSSSLLIHAQNRNQEKSKASTPWSNRMKVLAGIKQNNTN